MDIASCLPKIPGTSEIHQGQQIDCELRENPFWVSGCAGLAAYVWHRISGVQ